MCHARAIIVAVSVCWSVCPSVRSYTSVTMSSFCRKLLTLCLHNSSEQSLELRYPNYSSSSTFWELVWLTAAFKIPIKSSPKNMSKTDFSGHSVFVISPELFQFWTSPDGYLKKKQNNPWGSFMVSLASPQESIVPETLYKRNGAYTENSTVDIHSHSSPILTYGWLVWWKDQKAKSLTGFIGKIPLMELHDIQKIQKMEGGPEQENWWQCLLSPNHSHTTSIKIYKSANHWLLSRD